MNKDQLEYYDLTRCARIAVITAWIHEHPMYGAEWQAMNKEQRDRLQRRRLRAHGERARFWNMHVSAFKTDAEALKALTIKDTWS